MAEVDTEPVPNLGRTIIYCGVCTLPPEYCEYGGTKSKCQEWLKKNNPEMHEKIWSAEALEAATSNLSLEAQERVAKDAKKKERKAEAAEQKEADKRANSMIVIKRIDRNKRKFVTSVVGLEAFNLEPKKVAKDFKKKFATGASSTQLPGGGEEVIVQGDLGDDITEFLFTKFGIPEDNIEIGSHERPQAERPGPG